MTKTFSITQLLLILAVMPLGLSAQQPSQCADTLKLTVSTVKRSEDYASVIKPFLSVMAEALGKKPQLVFTDGWAASVNAFSENSADLVLVPQSMLAIVNVKPELRPVVRTPGATVILIAEKNSDIHSIEQLGNQRVGTVKDSTEELMARKVLAQAGLSDSVELISVVSPGDAFMGLFQDRFAGAFVIEPSMDWLQPSFKNKLVKVEVVGSTEGLYLYAGQCVGASGVSAIQQALLAEPPDPRVSRFIRHFNFGHFIAASRDDVEKALQQLDAYQ